MEVALDETLFERVSFPAAAIGSSDSLRAEGEEERDGRSDARRINVPMRLRKVGRLVPEAGDAERFEFGDDISRTLSTIFHSLRLIRY